jgi:DNA sulfur modification protein DndD
MIFKKLTLHNFGLYAGTNTFDFDAKKPVILIGGMNGRGKTTFLESVLLVLYGRRSFAFLESKLSYPAYLRKLVNVADGTLKTYIELDFIAGNDAGKHEFVLRREWSMQYEEVKDTIRALRDGADDAFLSDNWAMYVEELLPSAISNFFFFDGEKISELAIESTDEQMRNSIKMLLGIDVLDRLEADLRKILADKSKKLASSEYHQQIQELRDKESALDKQLTVLRHDIAEISTCNDQYQREINILESLFMAKGGMVGNNKAELLSRKNKLEGELNVINEQLLELISSELPLALVEPLLQSICQSASNEQAARHEMFANRRIHQMIDEFRQATKSVSKQMESFIDFVEASMKNSVQESDNCYDLSENALLQAKLLSGSFLRDKKREAKQLQERKVKIKKERDEVENYLLIEVDENATGSVYAKIKGIIEKIGSGEERKRQMEIDETEISIRFMQVQRELTKLNEKYLSEMESFDEAARIVRYTNNALHLLAAYRLRLQSQKTTVLAETMTTCYKKIANKRNLVNLIEIDKETLDFICYDTSGAAIDKKRLSAGEKQLMVVAMLWSLALCSHNKLPVIIDTPLARLDSAHREQMVNAYFPHASEQTIILSTDTEINSHYHRLLKPAIGKEFTLVYDDATKSTTIKEGYFGG